MRRPLGCVTMTLVATVCLTAPLAVGGDFPAISRRLPPKGIDVSDRDRTHLQLQLDELGKRIASVSKKSASAEPRQRDGFADVAIFHKAVDFALKHGEFYQTGDIGRASSLLKTAHGRLDQLSQGRRPWTKARGLVVRGYQSQLDDSFQPFGLVIPQKLDLSEPVPLYVWLHGRGDKITDLNFIHQRMTRVGRIAPANAIVLHPFGRYCNAFKFAGEVDVFEAIEAVKRNYRIDPDRIVLWGFSMGGAGCWHLGAHHPDRWVAISPGAGFAETRRYQNIKPKDYPPKYEQILWNLFDVPSYTRNLFNLPLAAYSGEKDKQIQAALVMEEAFVEHGRKLHHIIGPGMGHAYHPKSLAQISRFIEGHVNKGVERFPRTVSLQTRTLRYNRCHWVEILGLERHWRDSRVDARAVDPKGIIITSRNVTALRLSPPWRGSKSFAAGVRIEIDGTTITVPTGERRESLTLSKKTGGWKLVDQFPADGALHKSPGLQGPIDDVFMEPFLVVRPQGPCSHPMVEKWVQFELKHFLDRWRALFRGEARLKMASEVTKDDMRRYHLILWGDAASNSLIRDILKQTRRPLPLKWNARGLSVGSRSYDPSRHVPVMIYPNPMNPRRYVVMNSGMTFREGHDRTNSLQNPKLPDWAVIDLNTQPSALQSGKVVTAGFFDERWRLIEK